MSQPDKEIEGTRQVGQISTVQVEFACIVERRRGNIRRVNYEVRINGWPSSASFYVEGDSSEPTLGDSQIEAACEYIRKFLRDGITDGIETIFQEAYQLTHGGQTPSKTFLKAFLRHSSDYLKEAAEERLKSGTIEKKRTAWLKFEATAKCHHWTELLKEYRADYQKHYQEYCNQTHQTSHARFRKDKWDQYEREKYADKTPEFFKYARRVVSGRMTPGEAARQWVSENMKIPASSLERRYIRRPWSKRRRPRSMARPPATGQR